MAVANQAGVRKSITASLSPPTSAKISNINVNSTKDRIMLQRWQGPGFTCVRVINMMDFVLTYLGNSTLVPFYCLFYGLSIRVSGYISRLNSDIH